jgi:enoyl-CoA hydratase/carnithine racemase
MSAVFSEVHGDVVEIVLNRPDKRNALRDRDVIALAEAIGAAGTARAVVLRAEGRAFCAGRDLSESDPRTEDGGQILRDTYNPLIAAIAAVPAPTLAAVQGACLGAGLGLALACDLMYVADDARIGSPFARIGAVLDSGAHRLLVDRIGSHRTLELVYTGRLLSGREAMAWGIANHSVGRDRLLPTVRRVAAAVAAGPTAAFRASKAIVGRVRDEGASLAEVLALEADAQHTACRSDDYAEGITAFLDKRTPAFLGR